jgi:hypothetical protein
MLPPLSGWFKKSMMLWQCLLLNSAKSHKSVIPYVSSVLLKLYFIMCHVSQTRICGSCFYVNVKVNYVKCFVM